MRGTLPSGDENNVLFVGLGPYYEPAHFIADFI